MRVGLKSLRGMFISFEKRHAERDFGARDFRPVGIGFLKLIGDPGGHWIPKCKLPIL